MSQATTTLTRVEMTAILHAVKAEPMVAEYATSLEILLTLVGAGYGIGFAIASQAAAIQRDDVVARPLAGRCPSLTTFLLRNDGEPSQPVRRFTERLLSMEGALSGNGERPAHQGDAR